MLQSSYSYLELFSCFSSSRDILYDGPNRKIPVGCRRISTPRAIACRLNQYQWYFALSLGITPELIREADNIALGFRKKKYSAALVSVFGRMRLASLLGKTRFPQCWASLSGIHRNRIFPPHTAHISPPGSLRIPPLFPSRAFMTAWDVTRNPEE
jgi:hypothetical protein